MPKIDEIQASTDISAFIDYGAIAERLDTINDDLKKMDDGIIKTLKTEMLDGGLDLYCANINGVPIYRNEANKILTQIETVHSEMTRATQYIKRAAYYHRRDETMAYQRKIQNKIDQLKDEIGGLQEENTTLTQNITTLRSQASFNTSANLQAQVEQLERQKSNNTQKINDCNTQISELEEKANAAVEAAREMGVAI